MVDERTNEAAVRSLRELADFLEAHPHLMPAPIGVNVFVQTREEIAKWARQATWTKKFFSDWFCLRRTFGGLIDLDLNIPRAQVCKRVVTGTRVIPVQPEHEVEIVEWECEALFSNTDTDVPSEV